MGMGRSIFMHLVLDLSTLDGKLYFIKMVIM
ncbi:hypothetical protein B2K_38315 [Paenibacillus mucilaginosus K02]|uniref:Uncharacterized protein n=1 Tax=Paenibacillus mucilaginosus K02 TaxID=997761 RepID=R9UMS7_9BACL|nr:hypothetical protein B2K_38315 [Paenibacillus mucilaginosus K02]